MIVKRLFLCFIVFSCSTASMGQAGLSALHVNSINGRVLPLNTVIDTTGVTVVCFWATWCIPCINELDALEEKLGELSSIPCKLIAISVDETRTAQKVKPFVQSRGWSFEVYMDPANELMRAFQINNIPYIVVFKQGKPVYNKQGYLAGDEAVLLEKIKQLSMPLAK
jgi:cytochrome c biogenesis protein CcmG, thiol:disulfide interchange protein DsbE